MINETPKLRRYECEWKQGEDLFYEALYPVLYHEEGVPTEGPYYRAADVDPLLQAQAERITALEAENERLRRIITQAPAEPAKEQSNG